MATDARLPLEPPGGDLGFGNVVTQRRGYRLLNRDGSFNVKVLSGPWLDSVLSYHTLLNISWGRFFAFMLAAYVVLNAMFAAAYLACGPHGIVGDFEGSNVARAFFFSVHTFATIGYGNITPHNLAANVVVTFESLVGLMALALATGIVFARFSRPIADIRYSRKAVIAPYRDVTAFEFRVVNGRKNQLVNVEATVMFSRFEGSGDARQRRFFRLPLERNEITFFPMNWTIVHPIDKSSPLWSWDPAMLREAEAEFEILLTATDETFSQTVHSRSSYSAEDVEFGYKFEMMYSEDQNKYVLDLGRLDSMRPAALPSVTV